MSTKNYKPGDKVKVKSLDWFSKNEFAGNIYFPNSSCCFNKDMSAYCGATLTILTIRFISNTSYYVVQENSFAWSDEMFEDPLENTKESEEDINIDGIIKLLDIGDGMKKIIVNKDYELMIDPDGDSFVVPKLKFPKTYFECSNVLEKVARTTDRDDLSYNPELIYSLQKLLICRDAYWKLLGNWKSSRNEIVYGIYRNCGLVDVFDELFGETDLLEFPTREIRDLFLKNFKDLIESVKELL